MNSQVLGGGSMVVTRTLKVVTMNEYLIYLPRILP
jgi:hypothetical protein